MYMTFHIRAFPIALVLFVLAVMPVYADVVVLQNGESLSGTFSRIRDNTLVFRTSMQGQLMTPMSEVHTLSAEKMLCITMTDGHVYYGRLGVIEEKQHVFLLSGDAPVSIDVANIQETLPIPAPPAGVDTSVTEKLMIEAGTGVQWRSDSASGVEPTVQLKAQGRNEKWRFDADVLVERADTESFPAYLQAQAELFGNGASTTKPYISIETDRDLDRLVELRQHLALGLYHTLYDTNHSSLGTLTAIDLEYEQEHAPGQSNERKQGGLNIRLGLRYYQLFAKGHSLSTALMVLPSLTDGDRLRTQSETIYTMPVTNQLHLRLELIIGYDNDPLTSDINRWNTMVGAGVNLAF